MAADDEAPQRLLQVIHESIPDSNEKKKDTKKNLKELKEEERKFGVFYDDAYDYMQHLKDREAPEYDWSELDNFIGGAPKDKNFSSNKSTNNSYVDQSTKVNQVFFVK